MRKLGVCHLLALALLLLELSPGDGVVSDDALLRTANDLYMQARSFEDSQMMLLAMRTLMAAARLLPTDTRVIKKRQQIHAQVSAVVAVPFEGETLALPVWIPQTPSTPGQVGSADDMVRTPARLALCSSVSG